MSQGTMCLTCRHYITPEVWGCKCVRPIPSDDGKTPNATAAMTTDADKGVEDAAR